MLQDALDGQWMASAIQLAKKGWYTTAPNPRVGCVIIDTTQQLVGEGWHQKAGEPHAEVYALRQAGDKAVGATACVTLEPCSHYGRTPPCAEALIKAGIARVVIANKDPNPLVAGKGITLLENAGIAVVSDVLADEAYQLNRGFFKRMTTGKPFVQAKLAMSLDGRTAMQSGESQWITGSHARGAVQKMRAQSDAIITGIGSILQDNSSLTVRAHELPLTNAEVIAQRQPLRIVLDSQLQIPLEANILQQAGRTIIATLKGVDAQKIQQLTQTGAEVWQLPEVNHRINLEALLIRLGEEGCNNVLLETGATLAGTMLSSQLIDEIVVFIAPILMGSDARALFELPIQQMQHKIPLTIKDIRAVGQDWQITATPEYH